MLVVRRSRKSVLFEVVGLCKSEIESVFRFWVGMHVDRSLYILALDYLQLQGQSHT